MAVERLPLERLQTQKTTVASKISAMGQVKSAIASLQEAAADIAKTSSLYSYKGTLADTSIATATTTSSAVAGTYSVEVEQLATNHKLQSAATVDPSAGGTLTIEIGSTASGSFVPKSGTSAVAVTINAGSSLSDVATAINEANAGVSATVVNGTDGPQLIVTSDETGETNQIKITSTISGLGFDPEDPLASGNLTQATEAKNAILKIDGITIADTTSNTVTDAITGVTLNLTATNDNDPTQLVISNDPSNLETKLQAFVDAYNSARSTIKTLSKYDSTGTSTGVLNGDTTVTSALNQLRSLLSTVPSDASSSYQYLSELGVTSSSDGTLSLDTDVLATATTSDFASVAKTVAAYGTAFDTLTTDMNDSEDGLITVRIDGLNTTSNNLDDRIESTSRLLEMIQARYEAQFTSLETLLASMDTTSTYLTQQLDNLVGSSS
jgi:flagellar hook-associated protein 2